MADIESHNPAEIISEKKSEVMINHNRLMPGMINPKVSFLRKDKKICAVINNTRTIPAKKIILI
jgi:hypothetical protein